MQVLNLHIRAERTECPSPRPRFRFLEMFSLYPSCPRTATRPYARLGLSLIQALSNSGTSKKTDSLVDNLDDGAIRRILHDAGSNLALESPVVERLCCHEEISRAGIIGPRDQLTIRSIPCHILIPSWYYQPPFMYP